jgi:HK97 gp10 family phage protein
VSLKFKLTSRLSALADQLPANVRERSVQVAEEIAARARQNAPRRTGHLADESIHVVPTENPDVIQVVVSTADAEHEEYAADVEYGTSKQAAEPYLTPAVEAVKPDLPNITRN